MTKISSTPDLTRFHVPGLSDAFYCPISCDIMHDPVTIEGDPTGQSYERSEIEHWFRCCLGPKRAPTSNLVFENPQLIANDALRAEIAGRTTPSAPPLPHDTYVSQSPRQPSATPGTGFAQPTWGAPRSFDAEPSAPPWSPDLHVPSGRRAVQTAPASASVGSAPPAPEPRPMPYAVGASANDFKNVIALGKSRIGREVDGSKTLASYVSATVGAVGGLTGAAAAAFGLACGATLAPCLALAAGVGLVGAGVGLGVLIRRRQAHAARAKPEIAGKLDALHDMRRAFQGLHKPTLAEKAILKDIRSAIDLVDSPRADWIKSLKWAGGAALIAIPIGLLVGLGIASRLRASKQEKEVDSAQTAPLPYNPNASARARRENAYEAAARRRAAGAATGNTYIHNETHYGPRYESTEPFSRLASDLLWRHQFGGTRFEPYRPSQRTWGDEAEGEVRVPMKSSWLEALDTHSYARLQREVSAR